MQPIPSLLLAMLALAVPAAPVGPGAAEGERDAGLRADLAFLVRRARAEHAAPARPAHGDAFAGAAAALDADLPQLTDAQVLMRMMRLLAMLGDGHTALWGPLPDSPLELERRTLPLKFYVFPSGLHLVDGAGPWLDYAGSRVLRFGPLDAELVLDRLSAYRGVDNAMTWTWIGAMMLRRVGMLAEVGVPVTDGAVELTLLLPEGAEEVVRVQAADDTLPEKLRPFPLALDDPPLWLSDVETNLWMRPLPEHDALYVQFNQVRDAPTRSIAAFSEELRSALRSTQARTLVVDVRHNNGGNNTLLRPLVRALIEFDMRAPEHELFVLMGRNTFSAAQNFLNRVERWTDATFAGEPSASSPNFTGETNEFVLPYSRLQGSISNRFWQDSDPWDDRPWIEPDLAVPLTIEDYVQGRDPLLVHVLGARR